jgi:hypothetical protein
VQRERPGTSVPDAFLGGVDPGALSVVSGYAIITFTIAGLLALVLPRAEQSSPSYSPPSMPPAIDFTSTGMLAFALAATTH